MSYGKPMVDDAKGFYDFASFVFDRVCDILDIDKEKDFDVPSED